MTAERDAELDVKTFVTEKNHRYTVESGTKIASVCLPTYNYGRDRFKTEEEARRRVILAFEKRFGPISWDLAVIQTTFVTVQVLVELRVDPV